MKRELVLRAVMGLVLLIVGGVGASHASASVVIAGTRVVYNSTEREVTIRLTNEGALPALVQVWLDKGDDKAAPADISVPFTVAPPVTRIDSGKGQTLRIFYTKEPLPQDKESVFWLNVLEIPPEGNAQLNKLQLAFRSRIKFFYRPADLTGTAQEAPAKIEWRLLQDGKHVELRNPTPYFVSFAAFEVDTKGKASKFDDGGMVGPGETKAFLLHSQVVPSSGLKIRYHAISDFGGAIDGEASLRVTP
ncbi:fimbrial chaperone protein/chaperone protein EcpD [Pseudomonas sp. 3296]|uniref:fimbria/pilus periplasmic chaperone n=1 Tax=Pseudomonas sp. 3296 TaxID=2817753 RepID=UPI00285881E9|nr:fimbria/pilus periplasmic chaperone [Pseudomonas sp. 3296]MDR6919013.1 fimbrial chaperone protein/chaperone protein EcpD [Pseudomonas sp. 3296]